MSIELLERVVGEMAPRGLREIIPTTMGEPLMYTHFDRIVDVCHKHHVRMNLTTNGSFWPGPQGRTVEAWGALLCSVLSDVKISWNGATKHTQEKIMRHSNFDTQIDSLRRFIAVRDAVAAEPGGNRASVTLQVTFTETNLAELPDIVRLAVRMQCDRVKGHHLWSVASALGVLG
jgi:MoaA/NifB/PqqE/SkfB family radical SAM enzyme